MNERVLMKWGGVTAFLFVALFVLSSCLALLAQGLPSDPPSTLEWAEVLTSAPWRAFVPVFSIAMCLLVVVAAASYRFLTRLHPSLATVGLAFGVLLIVIVFVEIAVFGAAGAIAGSDDGEMENRLAPLQALLGGLHTLAIWFHGLWLGVWGLGFLKLRGRTRLIGVLLLSFSGIYATYYGLLRVGNLVAAELTHLVGHSALVVSHLLLGMVLVAAASSND